SWRRYVQKPARLEVNREALLAAGGYSEGVSCAMPIWQSMQVLFAALRPACICCANSFCLAMTSGVKTWQVRQLAESFSRNSAQTSLALRARSFLNFSSVPITPRNSPMASLVPALALYQSNSG